MIDKLSKQQRLIIATVASMLFVFGYSYFFAPAKPVEPVAQTSVKQEAPIAKAAPTVKKAVTVSDLSVKSATDLVTITAEKFIFKIDNLGRISSVILKDEKYKTLDGDAVDVVSATLPKPLEMRFQSANTNEEAFKTPFTANVTSVTLSDTPVDIELTQKLSTVEVKKYLRVYPDGHYDLKVKLDNEKRYFLATGFEPKVYGYQMTVEGALIKDAQEQITIIEDGDAIGDERFSNVKIASAFDRYYTTLFYGNEEGLDIVVSKDAEDRPILFVDGKEELSLKGYVGPKEYNILKAISPELTDAIEYGWFTFIANPIFSVLNALHAMIGNWGWAIIVLTFLIRVVLFPLTYKGMVSMQKLKDIAPQMKELQKKYKDNPQQMNAKVMALYKKHGANPMGGCLPLLLQIPVFFAIYRVLLNSIELQGAEFALWITDLAVKDPYFVLPILLGVSMFVQQKLTPTNFTDPMQEKIMKFLPLIFTFFFITFPAGLTLYWFVNNLFSIAQQYYINKRFEKIKLAKDEKQ